ncbi:MAG TPA: hypothetical protein DFK19_16165 [Ochrobactrum sp.]|nr:hypothetical protein [Ochrobactrum sp.]
MSRWVRVQTSIFDHELFQAEPLTEREAWLWLIANAAWKATRHRIGSDMHEVPAGSLFVTLRQLQTAWKWKSDYRVRSFLKLLEKEEMIICETNAGKTQVTICNYSHYQEAERTENANATQEKRTKDTNTPNTSSLRSDVKAQAPEKPSVKSELMKVVDEDHAQAVIEHRKAIKKPMTVRAAQLLAGKFAKCQNPNAAVDMMISSGWQGFEPEWLENRKSSTRREPPPKRGETATDIWAEELRERGILRDEPDSYASDLLDVGDGGRYFEGNVRPLRVAFSGSK